VPKGALRQGYGLPAGHVHGDLVLTLVVLESDVGLPLALQVALLSSDAVSTAKQGVAAEGVAIRTMMTPNQNPLRNEEMTLTSLFARGAGGSSIFGHGPWLVCCPWLGFRLATGSAGHASHSGAGGDLPPPQ
jgi:hypothetical protein